MFHKKLKQMGAWLLAFSLVLGSAQLPAMEAKAADTNLALTAEVSASSAETSAGHGTDKINDGDDATRWAQETTGSSAWVVYKWNNIPTIKSFSISWERRNANAFSIQKSSDGKTWSDVWSATEAPTTNTVEVTLDTPVQSQYLRLNITDILSHAADDAEGFNWQAVSVYEFKVFGEAGEPLLQSGIDAVMASITAPAVSDDGTKITMPAAQEGVTVRFCADYEQVIGEDGTIYTPLEEKVVKGFYEVSDGNETKKTQEYTVTVPGQYTDDETANAKPAVIPELQEWHGESGNFVAKSSSRIVYGEGLEATAKEFAADYKDITGREIETVAGAEADVKAGDYFLTLGSADAGLGKEGYRINIGTSVKIEAAEATGAYWGVVSVLQILKQNGNYIPKGVIRDYPKYEVRGFSLDIARKPFSLDTVKQFIKNMSWYKLNNFQAHLNDGLIFLEDYNSIDNAIAYAYAGYRLESDVVGEKTGKTATSEDMYYTKDEFRSLIQDSRVIGVDVIPEIDLPAHALAITRAFSDQMLKQSGGGHSYLIDEFDLGSKYNECLEVAKKLWDDYITGDNPVFDKDTILHIGTDEFQGGNEAFRKFSDDMIKYVQRTGRKVRMWGSLTEKSGTTEVTSDGVQLNVWNTGWANPQAMYTDGFGLINTLDGYLYMVPNGNGGRGGYGDYLDTNSLYKGWTPNTMGGTTIPAGDDQMLGACYAIWHDNIDTRKVGITEYDSFERFHDALPTFSSKLWTDPEKSYEDMNETAERTGTAPNTNMYGEVETKDAVVMDYTFDETVTKDSSANSYDASEQVNVKQVKAENGNALQLAGGESYITTPVNLAGSHTLTMKVKMDEDAEGEQILCESWDAFGSLGTYSIKAAQKGTGKVGFSREGYDYSFDYTLPKGEWVTLTFKGGQNKAELYVNGTQIQGLSAASGLQLDALTPTRKTALASRLNEEDNSLTMVINTLLIPVGRIGSKTNSFKGLIDEVTVKTESTLADGSYLDMLKVPQSELTAEACSEIADNGSGLARYAIDGLANTYWHSNYNSDKGLDNSVHTGGHWFQITLTNPTIIDKLTYLPRQDNGNGRIYKYDLEIIDNDGNTTKVVTDGSWANDTKEKTASFDPIEAKSVKLYIKDSAGDGNGKHGTIAELNLYRPVSKENFGSALAQYEQLKGDSYVAETWAAFEKILKKAQAASTDSSVDMDSFLVIMDELSAAKAALKTADSSYLAEKMNEAGSMDVTGVDSKYVDALETAIAAIEKDLEEKAPTSEEFVSAISRLEEVKAPVALSKATQKKVTLEGMTKDSVEAYNLSLIHI